MEYIFTQNATNWNITDWDANLSTATLISNFLCICVIAAPFVFFRDVFFAPDKPMGELGLVFRVHKSQMNPLYVFDCEVSVRTIGAGFTTTLKNREGVIAYVKSLLEDEVRVYMITYDINFQMAAMKSILGPLSERVRFIDIRAMFLDRYTDISSVTFDDITTMMGMDAHTQTRVSIMEKITEKLVDGRTFDEVYKSL